jgi:hypothetical protein
MKLMAYINACHYPDIYYTLRGIPGVNHVREIDDSSNINHSTDDVFNVFPRKVNKVKSCNNKK